MIRKLTLAVALSAALGATAHASARRCPALQVGQGDVCDCIVQNYAEVDDRDITIKVLGASGSGTITCGPRTIGAENSGNCAVVVDNLAARCGCEVTGASSTSKVSLMIEGPAITDGAKVAVPCQ